jgi:hypothetical protein
MKNTVWMTYSDTKQIKTYLTKKCHICFYNTAYGNLFTSVLLRVKNESVQDCFLFAGQATTGGNISM